MASPPPANLTSVVGASPIPDISARSGMYGDGGEKAVRLFTETAIALNFIGPTDGLNQFSSASKVTRRAIDSEFRFYIHSVRGGHMKLAWIRDHTFMKDCFL